MKFFPDDICHLSIVVTGHTSYLRIVLLTVYRYAVCFVLVEKTKSAKNIWEPVFEDFIISGFLMADTLSKREKIYIFC